MSLNTVPGRLLTAEQKPEQKTEQKPARKCQGPGEAGPFFTRERSAYFAAAGGGTTLNTNDVGVSVGPNGPGTGLETGGRLLR